MARSIEQLVNRQFLRWVTEQRTTTKREKVRESEQKPMIVMSREYGARGAEIARQVAARLNFQFHSQELVHEIARHARVREQLVSSLDERSRDNIEQWVEEMVEGRSFSPNDYLRNLSKVIVSLGRHGKGVIVGRGSQFILDPSRTLRLRAFAPLEDRVKRIATRDDISRGDARAKVLRIDAERLGFHRQHFNVDHSEPQHYDLLLNTSSFPIETAVEIVVRAYRGKFRG
jgi:cytidylate kinase